MDPFEEALDLNDSDLSSFLRPCKRREKPTPTSTLVAISDSPTFTSLSRPETLDTPSPRAAAPTTLPRRIPGPAGDVQAAMYRKAELERNELSNGDLIPTQEYIRKAVQDGAGEDDHDFSCNPWLSAVDFVRRQGLVDGVAIGTPICMIKKCSGVQRIAQVVAVIKSSNPNGLGDLMVTLKDPTGSIVASLHHEVLTNGEYGRDIGVGSALILQKVVVLSPSRRAHCLNITRRNVVKVFSKDASILQHEDSVSTSPYDAPVEYNDGTWIHRADFTLQGSNEKGENNDQQQTSTADCTTQVENGDKTKESSSCSDGRNQNNAVHMESVLKRLDGTKGLRKALTEEMEVDGIGNELGEIRSRGDPEGSGLLSDVDRNENEHGVEKHKQSTCSKGLIPEWTDEQLDALCTFDCEDDGFL